MDIMPAEEVNELYSSDLEYNGNDYEQNGNHQVISEPPEFKAGPRPLLRHPRPNFIPRRGGPMMRPPRMGPPFHPYQMGDYPPRYPPRGPPPFMRGVMHPGHRHSFPPMNFMPSQTFEDEYSKPDIDLNDQISGNEEAEDDANRPPDLMSVRFSGSNRFSTPEEGIRPYMDQPNSFSNVARTMRPPFDVNGYDHRGPFTPNAGPPHVGHYPMGMPPRSMPFAMVPMPPNSNFPPPGMPPMGFPPRGHFGPPPLSMDPSLRPNIVPPVEASIGPPKAAVWVETKLPDGRAYYYNSSTRETTWSKPQNTIIVTQDEIDVKGLTTVLAEAATRAPPIAMAPPVMASPIQPPKPPEVAVWNEYKTPEGRPYYHNSTTSETVWEKPKVLKDWDSFVATLRSGQMLSINNEQQPSQMVPAPLPIQAVPPAMAAPVQPVVQQQLISTKQPTVIESKVAQSMSVESIKVEQNSPEKLLDKEKPKPKVESKPVTRDPSRPISSTPVNGTPWCVVWTGDRRVFFFNPSQHLSVWERPEDLKNRSDVDKLVEKCPVDEEEVETNNNHLSNSSSVTSLNHSSKESSEEPANKKQKLQNGTSELDNNQQTPKEIEPKIVQELITDSTDLGGLTVPKTNGQPPTTMESTKEAFEKAKQEQSKMSPEERVSKFREMLEEKEVNAYSIWEKELHKIVFDSRYLLLSTVERRQVFEDFVKDQAEKDRKEKKSRNRKLKEDFRDLLSSAELHGKSSFSDFCSKFGKDERFKAVEKSRERENYFYEFVDDLRKREREEQKEGNKKDKENKDGNRERNRKEREEASLREREKEVKEALSSSLREREKERTNCLRAEAETNFKALLVEFVKEAAITWSEAKSLIKNDTRWQEIEENIEKEQRREIYANHQRELLTKHKDAFRKLLDETKHKFTSDMPWKSVRKLIKEDARYDRLANVEAPQDEYERWQNDRLDKGKQEFLELLKDTALITSKTKRLISEDRDHLDIIKESIRSDRRYYILDTWPEKRSKWLKDYIDSMAV